MVCLRIISTSNFLTDLCFVALCIGKTTLCHSQKQYFIARYIIGITDTLARFTVSVLEIGPLSLYYFCHIFVLTYFFIKIIQQSGFSVNCKDRNV